MRENPDVIIVGAGPAGLSAALLLGRSRRRTLVIDSGRPRNAASHALHGFLTRDGIAPDDLLQRARDELGRYETVELLQATATNARQVENGFVIETAGEDTYRCRMLLLATGVVDALPDIPGIDAYYGRSVFHCPYCDGWEQRDRRLAAFGEGAHGLALELRQWSNDVTYFTGSEAPPAERIEDRLAANDIRVVQGRVVALEGDAGHLRALRLSDGTRVARDALFFRTHARQHSHLAEALGCEMTDEGLVKTGRFEITRVPGLFVAGDATRNVHLAIIAAAEGAQAAFAINTALMKADLSPSSTTSRTQTTR